MTYYDRQYQLDRTLSSLKSEDDFFVVIVDDNSPEDVRLPITDFCVMVKKVRDKKWVNGVPAWNIGFKCAMDYGADKIIIQNAECYHVGDVIKCANRVKDDEYMTFGCYSANKVTTFSNKNISEVIKKNNIGASKDGQNAWYNHSTLRPVAYHFCSAITAGNLRKLNGFDERFAYGLAYEDNYFLHQVKTLGLKVSIIDSPFVVHQWHYDTELPDKELYVHHNRILYPQLVKDKTYRAVHMITPEL